MPSEPSATAVKPAAQDDTELAQRIAGGDQIAFETLMRRQNGRLFRIARSILGEDADAEDALQDAYLDAYRHIGQFQGGAQLGTWLTRIVINHALMRLRKQKRQATVVPFRHGEAKEPGSAEVDVADHRVESPASATLRAEIRHILERRIDALPLAYRTVFIMREVEDMTVTETAESLGIPPSTVRTRLFRARALLRDALTREMETATAEVFGFAGERCDRIVTTVLQRTSADGLLSPGAAPLPGV